MDALEFNKDKNPSDFLSYLLNIFSYFAISTLLSTNSYDIGLSWWSRD